MSATWDFVPALVYGVLALVLSALLLYLNFHHRAAQEAAS